MRADAHNQQAASDSGHWPVGKYLLKLFGRLACSADVIGLGRVSGECSAQMCGERERLPANSDIYGNQ